MSRRRLLAAVELVLDAWAACACEVAFRPKAEATKCDGPASCAKSLLPVRTPDEAKERAAAAMARGDAAMARGDFGAADSAYTESVEAAPTFYTNAQKALTKRADARRCGAKPGQKPDCSAAPGGYKGGGDEDALIKDAWKVWLWGRGIRWPGHYIIALLIVRQFFVPPAELVPPPTTPEEKRDANNRVAAQAVVAISVLLTYNIVLFDYGLTY